MWMWQGKVTEVKVIEVRVIELSQIIATAVGQCKIDIAD